MSSNDPIGALLTLARRAQHHESARRDAASFQAFEARLERRGGSFYRHRVSWAAGVCLVLALAGWQLSAPRGAAPLEYHIVHGAPTAMSVGAAAASRLDFSDGSSVLLGTDSTARVQQTTAHGAAVVLGRGSLDAKIIPRHKNDWWFHAGPYKVHVLGTAFTLQWSPDAERFHIRMQSGTVTVIGPSAERGITVSKGQQMLAFPRENRLEVGPSQEKPTVQPSAVQESTATPDELAAPTPEIHARRTVHPRARASTAYARLVSEGKFAEAVKAAQAAGVRSVLQSASAADLAALADAARYERALTLSRQALLALRARFADSTEGQSAPYFLGRVSRGALAVRWYTTYVEEQPQGAFATAALGALTTLCAERGDAELARQYARDYLRRAPSGPYAAAARAVLTQRTAPANASSGQPH